MSRKLLLSCLMLVAFTALAVMPAAAQDTFKFGMILVGPKNDGGWSQANYEAGEYIAKNVPGVEFLEPLENVYAGNPDITTEAAADALVKAGAKVLFMTTDDYADDTDKIAVKYPDVTFIHTSGDHVYTGVAPKNVGNIMGQMEWGKMIAGCAAALTTQTGKIGFVGPLVNFETRRLVSSAYLGAKYCYENYRGMSAADLTFDVVWIGFWLNSPPLGTLDPNEVAQQFIDEGKDVLISGIDSTEAISKANTSTLNGKKVWAIPYDLATACDIAPDVCLGVPYFNWGPAYKAAVEAVKDGTWKQSWDYTAPDWKNINDPDTSAVGFTEGPALSAENKKSLDDFIAKMAAYATDPANKDTFWLWQGPLNYADGTVLAKDGEKLPMIAKPADGPSVWYLDQLVQGINSSGTESVFSK
jgi:simple sugar transport system substrate-binding protein